MARSRAESLSQTEYGAAESDMTVAERGQAVVERTQAEIEESVSQAAYVQPIAPTPPPPSPPQLIQADVVEELSISQLPPRADAHCSQDVDASLPGTHSSRAARVARNAGLCRSIAHPRPSLGVQRRSAYNVEIQHRLIMC